MKKYKLIKWYPSLHLIGVGFTVEQKTENGDYYPRKSCDRNIFKASEIENNPEFWEEIVKKDYEILSFKRNGNFMSDQQRRLATLQKDGSYLHVSLLSTTGGVPLEDMIKMSLYKIYSVKRLSDGEVFTIGDKAITKISNYGNITEFKLKYNNIYISTLHGDRRCYLSDLLSNKKPLFTTKDGVDIFEGDRYWFINLDSHISDFIGNEVNKTYSEKNRYRIFSTKEAAEEYILMNKPCLSINDLEGLNINCAGGISFSKTDVKELVKSRL